MMVAMAAQNTVYQLIWKTTKNILTVTHMYRLPPSIKYRKTAGKQNSITAD